MLCPCWWGKQSAAYCHSMMCSRRYDFDPTLPEERRRLVLTISPVHWAAEWLRPTLPSFKMVGPVLAGPGKPLPAHLEVSSLKLYQSLWSKTHVTFSSLCLLSGQTRLHQLHIGPMRRLSSRLIRAHREPYVLGG